MFNRFLSFLTLPALLVVLSPVAVHAAQLSTDARTAIPHDILQLVVIDYRAMQNSASAMALKNRVMPPDLKIFDEALSKSSLNDNHDVDQLAFALFRVGASEDSTMMVGIAQGQFSMPDILASFRKQKLKPIVVRSNKLYPLGRTGMMACFVDNSTMIFGASEAVTKALDARDGQAPNLLTNNAMMDAMRSVDNDPLWSILDQKGTQTMMHQILGEAGAVADYDSVKKRLLGSWYSMNFQHGVKLDLTLSTGDTLAGVTLSSLLNAALVVRKMSGSAAEKAALANTDITSNSGKLTIHFVTTDAEFNSLLQSPLFKSMVR